MTYKGLAKPIRLENGAPALVLDQRDKMVWSKLLESALAKGRRISVTAHLERKERTSPQLRMYWALLTILFTAVNGIRPTEGEKLAMHEDIKEIYGNRRMSTLKPGVMVAIGLSDGDTQDAGVLIDGVLQELSQATIAETDQMDARELFREFWALGGQRFKDEEDFRTRGTICAACGRSGVPMEPWIQKAHMESRGANPARIDDPSNWIPLCPDCHGQQHQHGVEKFLLNYPHLEPRWRERDDGSKSGEEMRNVTPTTGTKTQGKALRISAKKT